MEHKKWEADKETGGTVTDYFIEVVEEGYASGLVFKISYFKGGEGFIRIRDMQKLKNINDAIGEVFASEHLRKKRKL